MENWRGFVERSPYEELLVETFRQYEKGQLEEDLFRSIVAGLGLAVGTMFLTLQAERSGELQQAAAQIQQNQAELDSDQEKFAELESLLMNPNAWQWNPDPTAGLGFPQVEKDGEWHTTMPADWSIALQVAQDKEKGIVNIPGMASGELPSAQEIYDTLKNKGKAGSEPDLENAMKDLLPYMVETTELGADLRGVAKQMSPPEGPDMDTYQMSTIAVDPDYFQMNPDYVTVSGATAQDLYIQYYFGKYLGADEAVNFGLELGGQK